MLFHVCAHPNAYSNIIMRMLNTLYNSCLIVNYFCKKNE